MFEFKRAKLTRLLRTFQRNHQRALIAAVIQVPNGFVVDGVHSVVQHVTVQPFDLLGNGFVTVFRVLQEDTAHNNFKVFDALRGDHDFLLGFLVDTCTQAVLQDLHIAFGEVDLGEDIVFGDADKGVAVLGRFVFDRDFLCHLEAKVGVTVVQYIDPPVVALHVENGIGCFGLSRPLFGGTVWLKFRHLL